jgi:tRNA pseudouridine55 synthase
LNEINAGAPPDQPAGQRKREKRDVHGWLVLDKPVGMTSTHAVSVVKRAFQARRAGHAGTLDPLASGLLPIALGEATKTVPFVMDGRKIYRFTVRWGEERDTDDAEGRIAATSDARPSADEIRALLSRFTGEIAQVPPRYSAVKIEGERAYDLARDGEVVELEPRPVAVHRLELIETPDPDHSVLTAECGKGTYVRALARDLGRALGCLGHVAALRRTAVGPFTEDIAVHVEALQPRVPASAPFLAAGEASAGEVAPLMPVALPPLLPVEAGLAALPALRVSSSDAGRLARGQAVLMRGRDAPVMAGWVSVLAHGSLIALAEVEKGELRPRRIFNLPR